MQPTVLLAFLGLCIAFATPVAGFAQSAKNHFANIYIDNDKTGQAHFTVIANKDGDVEKLRTNVSVSILGIDVYSISQNLREEWENGQLQLLRARTDDDGDDLAAIVKRTEDGYHATLNGEAVDLPAEAFPLSVWHFAITKANPWFDPKDLKVRNVQVVERDEELSFDSGSVKTKRFDVSGDWRGTLWYDENNTLVQVDQKIKDHDVRMVIDR
jgi:hypothetical protein